MKKLVALVLALILSATAISAMAIEMLDVSSATALRDGYVRFPVSSNGYINGLMYKELEKAEIDTSTPATAISGNKTNRHGEVVRKKAWRIAELNEEYRLASGYAEEECRLEMVNSELLEKVLGTTDVSADDVANATIVGAPNEGSYKVAVRFVDSASEKNMVAKIHITRLNDYIAVYAINWNNSEDGSLELVLDAGTPYKSKGGSGSNSGGNNQTNPPATQAPAATPNPEYDDVILPPSISGNTGSGNSGSGNGSDSSNSGSNNDSVVPNPEYDKITLPWG